MKKVTPTDEMREAALKLGTGPIVFVYQDGTTIRMETSLGNNPYVWRGNAWVEMKTA